MDKNKFFTSGEFASKAGVTLRTIRYYDKIGLLRPSSHSEAGHRLYNREDFAKLQKILTLKFIGLSLEEIGNVMKYDVNNQDFKRSLEIQRGILDDKLNHMHMIIDAINETLDTIGDDGNCSSESIWEKFVEIINVINMDKKWMEQYENASNLRARINIHDLYSTNKQGWMRWYFEQLSVPDSAKILELGCGDANLWVKNIDRIPEHWDITLTDFSQGMLNDAKKSIGKMQSRFKFQIADACNIPFQDESFDVVIANHMIYHLPDIDRALSEMNRVLKNDGYFYASTVGKNHMNELHQMIDKFSLTKKVSKSITLTEKFQLENGLSQVSKWFDYVELKRYKDSLMITNSEAITEYMFSMPGNIKEMFDEKKMKELFEYLENGIKTKGGICITKDTGFFEGRKSKC